MVKHYKSSLYSLIFARNQIRITMPVDRKRLKDIVSRINTSSKAEFVKRLINNTKGYIPTGDGSVMTHRLGYVDDGDTAVVFPEVQSVGESLAEFYYPMSYERAVANGDTVQMSVPDAELFTQYYKYEYPQFKQYAYGGDTDEEEYFDIMPAATITAELPDIHTQHGKDIAKRMAERVANGQMSITDVPRSYQSYVEGEAKGAKPVREAINRAAPKVAAGLAATATAPYAIAAGIAAAPAVAPVLPHMGVSLLGGAAVDEGIRSFTPYDGWGDWAYRGTNEMFGLGKMDNALGSALDKYAPEVLSFTNPGYLASGPAGKFAEAVAKDGLGRTLYNATVKPVKSVSKKVADFADKWINARSNMKAAYKVFEEKSNHVVNPFAEFYPYSIYYNVPYDYTSVDINNTATANAFHYNPYAFRQSESLGRNASYIGNIKADLPTGTGNAGGSRVFSDVRPVRFLVDGKPEISGTITERQFGTIGGYNPTVMQSSEKVLEHKIPVYVQHTPEGDKFFTITGGRLPNNVQSLGRQNSEEIVSGVRSYTSSMNERLAGKGLVSGSTETVGEGVHGGIPNDTEVVTIGEYLPEVKRSLELENTVPLGRVPGERGTSRYAHYSGSEPRSVDVVLIDKDKNGFAVGKKAHEIYSTLFPEQYQAFVDDAVSKNVTDNYYDLLSKPLPNPEGGFFTDKELFELYKQPGVSARVTKTDIMGSYKDKHTQRVIDQMFDPDMSADSFAGNIKSMMRKYMKGYKTASEAFPNMTLSDVEANKEFLEKIGLPGVDELAADENTMRKIVEEYWKDISLGQRNVSPNFAGKTEKTYDTYEGMMKAGNSNYAPLNGTGSGGGGNQVSPYYLKSSGNGALGGTHHFIMQHPQSVTGRTEASVKTPLDVAKNFEGLQHTRKLTADEVDKVNSILKSHGAEKIGNSTTLGELNETLGSINNPDVTKQVSEALDAPFIRGQAYGENYVAKWTDEMTRPSGGVSTEMPEVGSVFHNGKYAPNAVVSEKAVPVFDYIEKEDLPLYLQEALSSPEIKALSAERNKMFDIFDDIDSTEEQRTKALLDYIKKYGEVARSGKAPAEGVMTDLVDERMAHQYNSTVVDKAYKDYEKASEILGKRRDILTAIKQWSAILGGSGAFAAGSVAAVNYYDKKWQEKYERRREALKAYEKEYKEDIEKIKNKRDSLSVKEYTKLVRGIQKKYEDLYYGNDKDNKHSEGGTLLLDYKSGGQIHIKPENRGKFTALKKRTGHSATWFKQHGTPAQRKMATFALNARKWKHADGGFLIDEDDPNFIGPLPAPAITESDDMIMRQRYAESTLNDSAYNKGSKATGAFQITPIVLDEYLGREKNKGDLNTLDYNRAVRDWYMNVRLPEFEMYRMGDPTDEIKIARKYAAYNAGPGVVRKALRKALENKIDINSGYGWLDYMPKETQDYVNFIVRGMDVPDSSKTAAKYKAALALRGYAGGGALGSMIAKNRKDDILQVIKKIKAGI